MNAAAVVSLDDKYVREEGQVFLTGLQALVRLPLDQHRADRRAGLRTATFISGYPGSPLAGFDLELERRRALLDEHHVVHRPGLNEELAATAVQGSQLVQSFSGARYDGVVGLWYGKGSRPRPLHRRHPPRQPHGGAPPRRGAGAGG